MTSRILAAAAAAAMLPLAQAGPPLLCDPFDIGSARSLPWGQGKGWHSPDPGYELRRLIPDTLALLDTQAPVIIRMETLRRAAIYSSKEPKLAYEMLARLMGRALEAEAAGRPDSNAWFDAGYLIETYRQSGWELKRNLAEGLDGYTFVLKALRMAGGSPEIEYSAALMKPNASWPNDHFRRAVAGSTAGTLLARNLAKYKGGLGH